MPQSNVKQYGGKAALVGSAGQKEAITPVTPIRSALRIQNTGANNLRVMFGRPTTGAGDDYIINPGATAEFRDPCPVESIYLSCNTSTTYCIIEENEPDEQTRYRVSQYLRDRVNG